MNKLKPSWRNILIALGKAEGGLVAQYDLPDGNGRLGAARGDVLRAMGAAGMVKLARQDDLNSSSSLAYRYGYIITDAGRAALEQEPTP